MEVKTKFNISEFVKLKTDIFEDHTINAGQILDIKTETCYAGTQVFYYVRQLYFKKVYADQEKLEGEFKWACTHALSSRESMRVAAECYREDELLACNEIVRGILDKVIVED